MNYSENRKKHLCSYANENASLKDVMGGTHRGRTYGHIIKVKRTIDKKDQLKKVRQYNLLKGVNPDKLKVEKLHSMAHYLTSSQILCYNYFRPLLDNSGHPRDEFISMLKSKGINITRNAIGEFEYNANEYGRDGRLEQTEFDFHLIDNTTGTEVFFEIKYTENGFGTWGEYASQENFVNFYEDMFKNCYALEKTIPDLESFSNCFQLYRNVLRVQRDNQYSIFVFPEENTLVKEEFAAFEPKITKKANVFAWTWNELTKGYKDSEFYKKYFAE